LTASHVRAPEAAVGRAAPPLSLHEVSRRFGSLTVLDALELVLAPGEVALVEGRNGAGKTTLLRIAAGLISANRGAVSVYGLDPERDRREFRRRVALLSAGDRGLYARLTVRQNLEFWAALALIPRRRRGRAIDRAIARFSLEDLSGRRVDRISSGQRQRVRLAMTFLHDPALVLLDEPTTSLDDEGIARVCEELAELTACGGAALWCAPSGAVAQLPVDRKYILSEGALEAV
jgi:ABC-type multidrug transport system ATPase subunit